MHLDVSRLGLLAAVSCLGMFLAFNCVAGEIRAGATMQVKANSIWFQDADKFAQWQQLKKSGNSAALASYQEEAFSERDAWQFINRLTVKILRYEPAKNQVNVEMMTRGRLLGSKWLLDADALVR